MDALQELFKMPVDRVKSKNDIGDLAFSIAGAINGISSNPWRYGEKASFPSRCGVELLVAAVATHMLSRIGENRVRGMRYEGEEASFITEGDKASTHVRALFALFYDVGIASNAGTVGKRMLEGRHRSATTVAGCARCISPY